MITYLYFNSIKVRLELSGFLNFLFSLLFQFHKGAIRTYSRVAIAALQQVFQFHKGAIRTRKVLGVDVLRIYGFVGAKIQKNLQKNVDA